MAAIAESAGKDRHYHALALGASKSLQPRALLLRIMPNLALRVALWQRNPVTGLLMARLLVRHLAAAPDRSGRSGLEPA